MHNVEKNLFSISTSRKQSWTAMHEKQRRLLIVANRLPITLKPLDNGGYDFQASSGGLAAGLKGLSDQMKFEWFGWPGTEVP